MVRKLLLISSIVFLCAHSSIAQKISPFDSLVTVLEKKYNVQFLYDTKHTEGLSIGAVNGGLEEMLKTILEGTGLTFHIDSYKRVIISRGSSVYTALPKNFFFPLESDCKLYSSSIFLGE